MQSFAIIESYLDGCHFNEVGGGWIFPWAGRKGLDEGREGLKEHEQS